MIIITLIDGKVLDFDMQSFEAEEAFAAKFETMPLNRMVDLKRLGRYTVAQIETIKFQPIKRVEAPNPKQKLQETLERVGQRVRDQRHKQIEAFVAAVTERLGYFPEEDPNIIRAMNAAGDGEDWKLDIFVNLACAPYQRRSS